jgi:hypothetical protein
MFEEMQAAFESMRQSELPSTTAGTAVFNMMPKGAVTKYLMANISDPDQLRELEEVCNASLRTFGELSKPGDVFIIREETHFDREGYYIVALKYLTIPGTPGTPVAPSTPKDTEENNNAG